MFNLFASHAISSKINIIIRREHKIEITLKQNLWMNCFSFFFFNTLRNYFSVHQSFMQKNLHDIAWWNTISWKLEPTISSLPSGVFLQMNTQLKTRTLAVIGLSIDSRGSFVFHIILFLHRPKIYNVNDLTNR